MNAALITYYLRWQLANKFKTIVGHLSQIIDCCGYNDNASTTLFSKGDFYVDDYFYKMIYVAEWVLERSLD